MPMLSLYDTTCRLETISSMKSRKRDTNLDSETTKDSFYLDKSCDRRGSRVRSSQDVGYAPFFNTSYVYDL